MATGSRLQRRVAPSIIWAIALSVLAHMLFLAAYSRMADWYHQQNLRPTRYLPDLLLLAPDLFRQQPMRNIPERLMEQIAATEAPGQSVPLPAMEPGLPAPVSVEQVPLDDRLPMPGERPLVFVTQPELADFSLNEADIEAVAQLRDQYDAYARYWSPDVDPDDAESQSRTKAEAIVARAFDAMGGLDRLMKVTELRAVVWVVAIEDQSATGEVVYVSPYPYPIARWHMHGLGKFEQDVFRSNYSLSSGQPFPSYLIKNPTLTRSAFYALFGARWLISAPLTTRKLRQKSENARWHLADQFLGEGIRLAYVTTGRLDVGNMVAEPVHQIRVDDRKYGRLLDAYLHRDTGLLLATREELTDAERSWSKQKNNRSPPTWVTRYDRYEEVDGVLWPHRWLRIVTPPPRPPQLHRLELHFNIAVNGAEPDTVAPEL